MAWAIDEPAATCARVFSSQGLQRCDERLGFLLSHRTALLGAVAADLGFDLVEFGDSLQGLGSDRCRGRFGEVEPLPAPMGPTECERHRPADALRIGEAAIRW